METIHHITTNHNAIRSQRNHAALPPTPPPLPPPPTLLRPPSPIPYPQKHQQNIHRRPQTRQRAPPHPAPRPRAPFPRKLQQQMAQIASHIRRHHDRILLGDFQLSETELLGREFYFICFTHESYGPRGAGR